mgnify:CR=1 FL=1|jgi:hypothetical protein
MKPKDYQLQEQNPERADLKKVKDGLLIAIRL